MVDSFSSLHFPYLQVHLQIGVSNKIELDLEALLDSGFGGGVAIPRGIADLSNIPFMDSKWVLADGTQVMTPAYLGYVKVGKFDRVPVVIIALGDEPLIGRQVLNNFKLILDHGRKVIIEP